MKKIIGIVLLGLFCCTSNEKKAIDVTEKIETNPIWDKEFLAFISLLPKIELPFNATCDNCCDGLAIKYDNELIQKFKPEGSSVVGLIDKTGSRAIILVTYPADAVIPAIKVYDTNGKLKGDKTFLTGYCGGEPGYYGKQFFRINRDLSLNQIDTSYHMTVDSVDYHTIDTTNIEITRKKFIINDQGEIVEDNAR